MERLHLSGLLAILCLAGTLAAQDDIQKGIIKKIDADKTTLIVKVDGKDVALQVKPDTRVMDASGQESKNPFKDKVFTPGAGVMFKLQGDAVVGIRLLGDAKQTKGNIQRGKIVKIDLKEHTVTLKSDGKDIDATATEKTNLFEAKGANLTERLEAFKAGAEVQFVLLGKDDKNYLVAMRLFKEGDKKNQGKKPPLVKVDSSKLVPIDELGDNEYKAGFTGGFYPESKNVRPKEHEAAGLRLATEIRPLGAGGKADPAGKIVMLSVGMSNTSQASQGFSKVLASAEGVNAKFVFVNGAVGGQTAQITQSTESPQGAKYWAIVDKRLEDAKLTRAQVQIIWIKQADAGPSQGFPVYAKKLEDELVNLVQIFPKRFPNAKMVYLSSRTYGGYATTPLNPEPYAYESAFSVKWLIERQLKGELNFDATKGDVKAPWLSWGPYLWANGEKKRAADGFSYDLNDFSGDGTHHSGAGSEKIGRLMLQFFKTDTTARPWFAAK